MELHPLDDTIAAISTPPGRSGIGIVRLSGPDALAIADRVFRPARRALPPSEMASYSIAYGHVVAHTEVLDEAILTVMRGPRTYTTQDVVELNCHGGPVPLRRALELLLSCGARLADPGEFTKRAFYFGRIDLAQAEAVFDIISARTQQAARAAEEQLSGRLSREVLRLRDELVDIMAHLEAAIDFGDDDLGLPPLSRQVERLRQLAVEVLRLIASADIGQALRDGVLAAIIGRPNVGKSSLMNALLGHERVIVTELPGTTRDVVEHGLNIAGVPVVLADTAGVRDTEDLIEAAGVERSRAVMERADMVLLVLDASVPLQPEDHALLTSAPAASIAVVNKSDLPPAWSVAEALPAWQPRHVPVSAREGTGLADLEQAIARSIWGGEAASAPDLLVTNVRHRVALEAALRAVQAALDVAATGLTEEYIAQELRDALDSLGEIVGLTLPEDIINRIFDTFCVGK